jgi:hypothetical protein
MASEPIVENLARQLKLLSEVLTMTSYNATEQAYKNGYKDGLEAGMRSAGGLTPGKITTSCEDKNKTYITFPDGLRLIFENGQYVGWYVYNAEG